MTDLMNIGRGGLAAYRAALSVTGENIANVETEGYVKRNLVTRESGVGGGVEIVEIQRAFDGLLAERSRDAKASVSGAQTYLTHMKTLEDRLLPGVEGVTRLLDGFFDALDGVSLAPAETGLRQVALSAAETLAGGVADLAQGLDRLALNVSDEISQAVDQANRLLGDLADLQSQTRNFAGLGAQNVLLDQRDRLLDQLGSLTQIDVSFDQQGRASVRLGAQSGGPLLLDGSLQSRLKADSDGTLTVLPHDMSGKPQVRIPTSGVLGGLSQAAGTIGQAIADLDAWSGQMVSQINAVHAQAVTQDGTAGSAVFSNSGWTVNSGALARGNAAVSVLSIDPDMMPEGPLTLVFDAAQDQWMLRDAAGTSLAQGNPQISVEGLELEVGGTPWDGDRVTLTRGDGVARHMTVQLTQPYQIATAGALTITQGATNVGAASLKVEAVDPAASSVPDLTSALGTGPVEFLAGGIIGRVPAGSGPVTLSAQPRLTSFEIPLPTGTAPQTLSVVLPSGPADFVLPTGLDGDGLATLWNGGQITASQGQTASDMQLVAKYENDILSFSVDEGSTAPQSIALVTSTGSLAAQRVSDESPASSLMVFTREGRQLGGPPLGPQAAAALITPENGFAVGAVYSADYLSSGIEFAQTVRTQMLASGSFAAVLAGTGGIDTWPATQRAPEAPASVVALQGSGVNVETDLPGGSDAAWRAALLQENLSLEATAETRMSFAVPQSGTLSFTLAGDNTTPVQIDVDLAVEGPAAVAQAINALRTATGISAQFAPGGNTVILVNDRGSDISLGRLSHSGGAQVTVARHSPNGEALSSSTLIADGSESLRVSGTVSLSGATSFDVLQDGTLTAATRDPFDNGPIEVTRTNAGSTASLTVMPPAEGDSTLREISVTGSDGRVFTARASAMGQDAPGIARNLLTDLRADAPTSTLTGAPLTALPADGTAMSAVLGDQTYTIQMVGNIPTVSGPETGRVTASFDATNRLVLETTEGALDGAALRLGSDGGAAARFGMGIVDAPTTRVMGQPFDAANLPTSFTISLGGTEHVVSVSSAAVILPPTFPGTGRINTAFGTVEIQFDARAGELVIPAQAGAANAGLNTAGLRATVDHDRLEIHATDARRLEIDSAPSGTGSVWTLDGNLGEDLLVMLSGDGSLQLSGNIETGDAAPRNLELRILDADQKMVGFFDPQSGAQLASRVLSPDGKATFGGTEVTLGAGYATGDSYRLTPATGQSTDARGIEAIANLRQKDGMTGLGGYGALFAGLQQQIGAQVAAADMRLGSAEAERDSAEFAVSQLSGVDLDAEAARLMQQHQAYQANAQVLTTAREIFDTLLAAI